MAQQKKKTAKKRTSGGGTKRTTKKRPYKKRATKRRRRNPSGGFTGRAASLLSLGNFVAAGKQTGGMLACQFFAKKFAGGGGANDPDWSWQNYAWGLGGTFAAGFAADMIKRGSGKQFVQGGLALLMYKLIVNELSAKSNFIATYFGADAMDRGGYVIGTDGNAYTAGDSYLGADGEVYLLGNDGLWRPTSENYRDPAMLGMGDALAPVGPLGYDDMSGPLAPVTPTLGADDPFLESFTGKQGSGDPYADVFLN